MLYRLFVKISTKKVCYNEAAFLWFLYKSQFTGNVFLIIAATTSENLVGYLRDVKRLQDNPCK